MGWLLQTGNDMGVLIFAGEIAFVCFIVTFLVAVFVRSHRHRPLSRQQLKAMQRLEQKRKEKYYNIGVNARKSLLAKIKGVKSENRT